MIIEYKPPVFPEISGDKTIFLGGSIEMGKAVDWQKEFVEKIKEREAKLFWSPYDWRICNPRRDNWDNSWEQTIENPNFYQQVSWELTYLRRCKYKVFYFAKDTVSPITLFELGLHSEDPNTYICAHPDYLRRGNLEVYCHMYDKPLYSSLDEAIPKIIN